MISNIELKSSSLNIEISSIDESYKTKIESIATSQIAAYTPALIVDFSKEIKKYDICLADPDFKNPDSIDLLLDVSVFDEVLKSGRISLGKNFPSLRNTLPQRAQANLNFVELPH